MKSFAMRTGFIRLSVLTAIALGGFTAPAFAPPPPPPPDWRAPTQQDLALLSSMAGFWFSTNGFYCRRYFYPGALNISVAKRERMVVDGQELRVTEAKFSPTFGVSIITPTADLGLRNAPAKLIYSIPGKGLCEYSRTQGP
jgi:H+/gluconate symporter-like permease